MEGRACDRVFELHPDAAVGEPVPRVPGGEGSCCRAQAVLVLVSVVGTVGPRPARRGRKALVRLSKPGVSCQRFIASCRPSLLHHSALPSCS